VFVVYQIQEIEMDRLLDMIARAYELALQAQDGETDIGLAEEVAGEFAEFLALWDGDEGAFDEGTKDAELVKLIERLKGEA
jgi:hypothetical protein